ncbi:hypothetical protein [Prochlorococcus sp. MIT 1307]|uniref:hypothetical protein n=1 Tax=Prochlorococcus sp. MIT 1307 TaxID=3096219 RepID=UPI002A7646CF|nr:hypothetical protein [Prochlorococcus sp. MIT 1307]
MRILIAATCLLVISFSAYLFLTGYRSAFEADQACHAEKWTLYEDNSSFGCDHDLETNQWILYEVLPNHKPSKVLKRFHY